MVFTYGMAQNTLFPTQKEATEAARAATDALPFGTGRFFVKASHSHVGFELVFAAPGPFEAPVRPVRVNADILAFVTRKVT